MRIPLSKIAVIPSGVNPEPFQNINPNEVRSRYGIGAKDIILYTGSLYEFQNIDYLLRAMSIVSQNYNNSTLLLVGNGNIGKYREMCHELGIQQQVMFVGDKPFNEVLHFLAAADVAVLPRINCPGIPQKLVNYMAAGKAIVSFKGSAKILSDYHDGLIISNGNTEEMANAIIKLLKNKKLKIKLGGNARTKVTEHYTWPVLCGKVNDIYHKVLYKERFGQYDVR
jgi:glycosyltransferase involved in cell wall biosynthesis